MPLACWEWVGMPSRACASATVAQLVSAMPRASGARLDWFPRSPVYRRRELVRISNAVPSLGKRLPGNQLDDSQTAGLFE